MTGDAKNSELEHELLRARDESIGLRAELTQARARIEELAHTPIGEAYARIDELEAERQALFDYVTVVKADTDVQLDRLMTSMQTSRTWRTGRLVLAPLTLARRLRRR